LLRSVLPQVLPPSAPLELSLLLLTLPVAARGLRSAELWALRRSALR
jgi:hypothetical protein